MSTRETGNIEEYLNDMADRLRDFLSRQGREDVVMIGIHTGGVWVANRLHGLFGIEQPLGELNINFYRDDFTRIGMHPHVQPSALPFSIDGRHIILVDDVLHTGRTIRAALNEIFDYGRPASATLVVLVDRSGRELPIQADIVGRHMDLGQGDHVKLTGPEQLSLVVQQAA